MALDFSKFTVFKNLNARSRVLVLSSVGFGIILIIYLLVKLLSGTDDSTGTSRVANAPSGLQSVQGGELTPEYYRSLQQENKQRALQAQFSGTSAIPTVVNLGQTNNGNQCIICSDQSANVKNSLDEWVRQGSVSEDVAANLQDLANRNVPVTDYEQHLAQLVKEGKLTPAQARELLEQYKKQHANALLQDSAKDMDAMIKSGELPIDVANELLKAQKENMSSGDYAALLNKMVREGKISPATAQKLLSQYNRQVEREAAKEGIAKLRQMAKDGQITPEIAQTLSDLQNQNVPYDTYANAVQQLVAQGKLTPLAASKLLEEYRKQKLGAHPESPVQRLLRQAEADAEQEIRDLLASHQITQEVADLLRGMMQKNIPLEQFKMAVNELVEQEKLSPEIAKLKIADYTKVKGLRDLLAHLTALQANNASPGMYANALKQAVQNGVITPAEAAGIMNEYQVHTAGTEEASSNLQQQLEGSQATSSDQFNAAQDTNQQAVQQDRNAKIQALTAAMSGQAEQLVSLWQAPTMSERVGNEEKEKDKEKDEFDKKISKNGKPGSKDDGAKGEVLVKSGTILFAVLDTTVNSDYPDSPVMATIVDGKFKGGKLMGRLVTTKGVSGQQDRITLNFTLMNMEQWDKSKAVTAYAIDPYSARTVLASQVDYHYLKRYGAIMATSFVQGYANAITTSASTTSTGIFGTSTTHPELSPAQKLATAIGQIGQSLGSVTQNYINIPPTVIVDSGVSLGILFMADLTT